MGGNDIRDKFLTFMAKQGHALIPSSALVPDNDPTTLFTGSGMQPLIPYLMGETHPKGSRLANSQKCFRANDIEEVGDNRHTTFFEMLGNWSLGDYFKREQLRWFFTYLVNEVGLDPNRIYVTVFAGDESLGIPRDDESVTIWKELFAEHGIIAKDVFIGTEENGYQNGMQGGRIFYYDATKNWWSRSGRPENMPNGEIGGPDSEVFYDFGPNFAIDDRYKHLAPHPNGDSGQFLEIGNSVFIEYIKQTDGSFAKLPQRNVDFGGGLERIAAAKNGNPDVFMVDVLHNVIKQIENLSKKNYHDNEQAFRIITDHIRGATFLIGDGILPGNTDQGYFVRRLLRRAVRYADKLMIPTGKFSHLAESVITTYEKHYPKLRDTAEIITGAIAREEEQFRKTLTKGFREIEKDFDKHGDAIGEQFTSDGLAGEEKGGNQGKRLYPHLVFKYVTTDGIPLEIVEEMAHERGLSIDKHQFELDMEAHKALSRAGAEHKFKGGLADHSAVVVQYHTTTHLMLAGLRQSLGEHVHQAGSNITSERLRYDFTHDNKLTQEEIKEIENYVNTAIKVGGKVTTEIMPKKSAQIDPTIEASFWDRYPDEVKVYTITGSNGVIYSRELCGGPHVEDLSKITGTFKIIKEESSSSGVRRIKAVLQ